MIDSKFVVALETFIRGAISNPRHERYLSLIRNQKRFKDFLGYLDHDFESHLLSNKIVDEKSFLHWDEPAFSINASRDGKAVESKTSVQAALQDVEDDGRWLIITEDGRAGVFMPEVPGMEIYVIV